MSHRNSDNTRAPRPAGLTKSKRKKVGWSGQSKSEEYWRKKEQRRRFRDTISTTSSQQERSLITNSHNVIIVSLQRVSDKKSAFNFGNSIANVLAKLYQFTLRWHHTINLPVLYLRILRICQPVTRYSI